MWGVGFRKAYKADEQYGPYCAKPSNKITTTQLMQIYSNIGEIVTRLDLVAQRFPQQYLKTFKQKLNVAKFTPEIDAAMGANIFITKDYCIGPHLDTDVGYAIVLWLLKHSDSCPFRSSKCIENWYFHLWADKIVVALEHGTVGFYNSRDYIHGTLSGKPTNPLVCIPEQIAISNQSLQRLLNAANKMV